MWTCKEAAAAWGTSAAWTRKIIKRVPGACLKVIAGKATWVIPEGSSKPVTNPPGRPFKK